VRYLLEGYYGRRNLGDDLLLAVALAEVHRLDPGASFTVVSGRPEARPATASVKVVPGGRRLETARQLLRHDVWLFGGGGLLQDQSPLSLPYLWRLGHWSVFARALGREVVLLGVGVGPLETKDGRKAARRLLENASLVTVRDAESAELVRELVPGGGVEVTVTGDLAFLARPERPLRGSKEGKTLGVSLLPLKASVGGPLEEDLEMAAAVAKALRTLLEAHPSLRLSLIELFAGEAPGDASVLRVLERTLPSDRVEYHVYEGDVNAAIDRVGACHAFLGMRFHSCLLAHVLRVPCLMIAYHPKSVSLSRALALDPAAVMTPAELNDSDELGARLSRLLTERERFMPGRSVDKQAEGARRNFTLMKDLLDHRTLKGAH
jgi:polysaccharide pyruvyl transferase CsaB